jgi:hypothetical protein
MLERFLACYGGDQPVHFQQKKKAFKTWFTHQTLTQIDLGDGKSFTLFYKTFKFTL